jgi:hypothetical protein
MMWKELGVQGNL